MDAPYYTVDVASLTRGWSYSRTHDPDEQADADSEPVVLAEPFRYSWAFGGGLVPGHLLPCTSRVTLWCADAAAVPEVQIGDLLTVSVRIGTDGPYLIQPPPLRAAAAEAEIVDDDDGYQVCLSVDLTDTLGDLANLFPYVVGNGSGFSAARSYFRPRFAEFAATIGRSIGCPTWWADEAAGHSRFMGFEEYLGGFNGLSARELITQHLNSAMPGGLTHTVVVDYRDEFPAGYRRVGPDVDWYEAPIAEPDTMQRFLLVPASRYVGGHAAVSVDADWCLLPAKARRSREHGHNTIRLSGTEAFINAPGEIYNQSRPALREFWDLGGDRDARGPIVREVATAMTLGYSPGVPGGDPYTYEIVTAVALQHFMGDDTSQHADYVYDAFDLVAADIPQADAEAVLPTLAPRFPGEPDGDGHVLRHLTIANLEPAARFDPAVDEVSGFVHAGELAIANGDLTYSLEMTPGQPRTF